MRVKNNLDSDGTPSTTSEAEQALLSGESFTRWRGLKKQTFASGDTCKVRVSGGGSVVSLTATISSMRVHFQFMSCTQS